MTMVSDIHLLYNPRHSQELIVLVPTCQAGLVAGQQDSGPSKTRVFTTRRVNDPFKKTSFGWIFAEKNDEIDEFGLFLLDLRGLKMGFTRTTAQNLNQQVLRKIPGFHQTW